MPLYTLPVWAIEHFLRILHFNMSKSVRVQFTMRFSGAGGFASLCRKSRLCGGLGGKKEGGGQEVGAVVLCAMELVGF